ncbi:hypothetical protein RhiirA4_485592 [Rhizophagus irregularis]|uniref:Uncharacterized protein n=1 Tax=Rhizophagus irregularis TaxID=588596 RepID=A0A2I1HQC5_9GLOM|nr:hypothetical protein RhiirA4_485592 [Rhizophagus irregularis]
MESAYKFTEYRYRFLKETKNFFSTGSRTNKNSQIRAERDSRLNITEQNFLESIKKEATLMGKFEVAKRLRRKNHMMDKKVNEEKKQERIISQKNEQIRKILQEIEKTILELKKTKTVKDKENDKPKNSKKGRSNTKGKKREPIIDISTEEDVRQNLSEIGKRVMKEILRKVFSKFVSKNTSSDVRDLTNEEMEAIKQGSLFKFIERMKKHSRAEFLKIIKITKNWKVIGYFKDQKAMEEAVEDSCTYGDIMKIWMKHLLTGFIRNWETLRRISPDLQLTSKKKENKMPEKELSDEEEVVKIIKNWRLDDEEEEKNNNDSSTNRQPAPLNKDNVAPEEYSRQIEGRCEKLGNGKNNFFHLRQKLLSLAEQSKIFREYTTLNEDFEQKLKNKNRYQDEKTIGEKKPMLESPSKIKTEPGKHYRRSPMIKEEDEEQEEEEEEKTEIEKPSKKKNGNSSKRKGKKKRR